jgi:tRNA modification GTPase
VRLRVWIEAAIDFPEEEIDFLSAPELRTDLAGVRTDLAALLDGARRGVRLADGLHVVIVGRPNAGKSSLLNALAASERAIVTEIPGTTRDLVRETVEIDGVALTLVDTAGLRDAPDLVEREGIRRAQAELARADVALLVTDAGDDAEADIALLAGMPPGAHRIVVHNKIDLGDRSPRRERRGEDVHLWLSAKTGAGLELVHSELRNLAAGDGCDGAWTARARHVAALERARAHLAAAESALIERNAGELAAEELRGVQHALGEITGEFSTEDLLGEIFGTFCIGK